MALRCVTGRNELSRILVSQFEQRERAAFRDGESLCHQLWRVEPHEARAFTQMTFAIGEQTPARFGYGNVVANGRDRILQVATLSHMHVHISTGYKREIDFTAEVLKPYQTLAIASCVHQFGSNPYDSGKTLSQPSSLFRVRLFMRQPQDETP